MQACRVAQATPEFECLRIVQRFGAVLMVTELFLARTMVLIPALNEAETVGETVRFWKAMGAARVRVINNGSSDETKEIAANAGAEVLEERRRGYGAACWTGLQNVPKEIEWILFSSADGSDRLAAEDLEGWERHVRNDVDFILGDRFSRREAREHLKWIQRFGNRLCCSLIYLGWAKRFNDMGSLRLIRSSVLRELALKDRGFGWNIEMQVRAVEQGVRMIELPVAYFPRAAGRSKISGSFRGTIRAAWGMTRMIVYLWRTRRQREKNSRAFS